MGKHEWLKILISCHRNPSLSVQGGRSSQLKREEKLKSEANFSNNTLRPQERMAFSVGEPVSSGSPPSCTKERNGCTVSDMVGW